MLKIKPLFVSLGTPALIAACITFPTSRASAASIGLGSVSANVTGTSINVPFVSTNVNFKVNVSNIPPLASNLRLTDFTAQVSDTILGLDRASIRWGSAPGWQLVSSNNVAGNASFRALSSNSGIAPGSFLDGFLVVGLGVDLLADAKVNITKVSSTAVPEPLTIFGSGLALGFGVLMERQYSRKRKKTKQIG